MPSLLIIEVQGKKCYGKKERYALYKRDNNRFSLHQKCLSPRQYASSRQGQKLFSVREVCWNRVKNCASKIWCRAALFARGFYILLRTWVSEVT